MCRLTWRQIGSDGKQVSGREIGRFRDRQGLASTHHFDFELGPSQIKWRRVGERKARY